MSDISSQISVIYEDADILAINKPAGLITHPKDAHDDSPSVVRWLIRQHPEIAQIHDPYYDDKATDPSTLRPGIVHRLDKDTSGILVIAKTQAAFNHLKKIFQDHQIRKTYTALVYGHIKQDAGEITAPLGKLPGRAGGTRQTTRIHGKHELVERQATTVFHVNQRYSDHTLLTVEPQTGRTHQIRVHLKSISHPIVCDPIYASSRTCPVELGRLFLHAQKLEFTAPSGRALTLEADLPSDLQNFLNGLARL